MLGTIKLFNKQNCDGCVIADDGRVMFFHRVCITPGYEPKVGDRVSFLWRASRTGTGGPGGVPDRACNQVAGVSNAFPPQLVEDGLGLGA